MGLNILVLNCVPDRPETESYIQLQRRGHTITLVTDPRDSRVDLYREAGIRVLVHENPYRYHLKSFVVLWRLAKARYDLVFAPTSKWLSLALLVFGFGKTPIVTYRGTSGNLFYHDPANLLTHLHPRVSRIICVSDSVRSFMSSLHIPHGKLVRIYKGHDPEWYGNLSIPERNAFGVPEDANLLVCVANVRPLKGIDVLLRALALCRDTGRCPRLYCLIVGDCPDDSMPALARQLGLEGMVSFLGFQANATAILGMADVSVMPSVRREGFPRAVLESMFQRVPAIVSTTGGMPEMVEHGVSGFVVPTGEAAALADCIVDFFSSSAEQRLAIGVAAAGRATEFFSHSRYTDELERVFSSCVASAPVYDSLMARFWSTLRFKSGKSITDSDLESVNV